MYKGESLGHYMRFISRHINHTKYSIGDPLMYILKPEESSDIFQTECITIVDDQKGKTYQFRLVISHVLQLSIYFKIFSVMF